MYPQLSKEMPSEGVDCSYHRVLYYWERAHQMIEYLLYCLTENHWCEHMITQRD